MQSTPNIFFVIGGPDILVRFIGKLRKKHSKSKTKILKGSAFLSFTKYHSKKSGNFNQLVRRLIR